MTEASGLVAMPGEADQARIGRPAPVVIRDRASGAELVRGLALSGTGDAKLAPARKLLADVWRDARRIASPAEVIAVLAESGAPDLTLRKARALAETGEWAGPEGAREVPIEEQLLGPSAPAVPLDAGEKPADAAKDPPPAADRPETKADPDRPGVHPTPAAPPATGPAKVAKK